MRFPLIDFDEAGEAGENAEESKEGLKEPSTDEVPPEGETPEGTEDEEKPPDEGDEDRVPKESDEDGITDEAEFIAQYDLPEEIKTFEQALDYTKNLKDGLLPSVKRGQTDAQATIEQLDSALKGRGFEGGIPALLATISQSQQGATAPGGEPPKLTGMFNDQVLRGEMSEEFRPFVQMLDKVMTSRDEFYNRILYGMGGDLEKYGDSTKNLMTGQSQMQYNAYNAAHKGNAFLQSELDELKKEFANPNSVSYERLHNFSIVNDPKAFARLLKNVEKIAGKRAFRKFTGQRGRGTLGAGKEGTTRPNPSDFVLPNGDIDKDKLKKLSDKDQDYVLDYHTKHGST